MVDARLCLHKKTGQALGWVKMGVDSPKESCGDIETTIKFLVDEILILLEAQVVSLGIF